MSVHCKLACVREVLSKVDLLLLLHYVPSSSVQAKLVQHLLLVRALNALYFISRSSLLLAFSVGSLGH